MVSPGKLQPLDIPNMPWVDVSVDFITDLPLSNGYDLILVVVDRFSKEVEFIPCNKIVTALETAKLYLFHVWKNHSLPRTIVSDCGPQFASQVMKDLCKYLGIISKLSTTHHLQTDGQMEEMNHDLQQYLHIFTVERQNEWADWIALAQFSYNTKQQASTRKSPFKVTCTYSSWMGIEKRSTKAPAADLLAEEISNTLESVKKNLKQAQDKMKSQANKHRSDTPIYQSGDQVWLSTDNLCLPQKSKKLSEKWIGPYPVVKMVGTNTIKLHLPCSMWIHPVINISRLKPYKEHLPGQSTVHPGPIEVTEDRDEEYEVEWIVDSHWKGQHLEYLISYTHRFGWD